MLQELLSLLKPLVAFLVGSGLTFALIAKFGQAWLFKKIDARYAVELAEKNSQLMGQLELKKNAIDKELQIEVAHFKSQLEVLGGQRSKFLESKIDKILLLNQRHYLAIKKIKELTDLTEICVGEAAGYFESQMEEGERLGLSDYSVYRGMHESRWPSYHSAATAEFNKYAECLALNMPVLPKKLVEEEMVIVDQCRTLLWDTMMNFHRAMNFTRYIIVPEECEGTEEGFMEDLIVERDNSIKNKMFLDGLSSDLFNRSLNSGEYIDSLLQQKI